MKTIERITPLLELVKNKTVLDIGCAGANGSTIHTELSKVTKEIIGIDIDEDRISNMQHKGYKVFNYNAEKPFDLKEKFDIVLASESLDYLCNLGIFMENVVKHLKKDGKLVIACHNPHALECFIEQLLFKKVPHNSYDHTHWQSEVTIKTLLKKYGLKLKAVKYEHYKAYSKLGKMYDKAIFFVPQRFARCIIFIAERNDN